ncbi:MAG: glycosyltransferase family 32 protein [Gammaproteobacteria bacterium]
MLIPKILHQIWINADKPDLPPEFARYRDTWLERHPDWEYRLWNLENLDFEPRCANLLHQAQHYAQMADLLRIEILHRHGGVYVDVDFECLQSIDRILEDVTAFACSEDGRCITNSILGCVQGSEVMRQVIESFPTRLGLAPVNVETGPVFLTHVLLTHGFSQDFTLFPTRYFFPFNYWTRSDQSVDYRGSYAVHHYADSWKTVEPRWKRVLFKLPRAMRSLVRRPS